MLRDGLNEDTPLLVPLRVNSKIGKLEKVNMKKAILSLSQKCSLVFCIFFFGFCAFSPFSPLYAVDIFIHYDVGLGNKITIRGDSTSLNWSKGLSTSWQKENVWFISLPENNFEFKPLINDQVWSLGENYQALPQNETIHIYPSFRALAGTLVTIPQFHSPTLNNQRDLVIYLPPSYYENLSKSYPVLYMHDGQNIFDSRTSFGGVEWQVDETLDRLIEEGKVPEVIVVGAYNTGASRILEYTPTLDAKYGGGQGEKYLDFLEKELIPYCNENYRTKKGAENTFLAGSSLGGLISFYAGWTRPHVFGRIACLSSSFWWNEENLTQKVENAPLSQEKIKIYLDFGKQENTGEQSERMFRALEKKGYQLEKNLFYYVDPNGGHNEASWAARLHIPLKFLLQD